VGDAVGRPAAIFINDNFHGVAHEHLDFVELHFAREVGEDFFAVCEDDAVLQIGEDFGYLASGCRMVHILTILRIIFS
jgi:hypothetical protein